MNLMDRPLKPMTFLTRAEVAAKWQHLLYGDSIILAPTDIARGMLGLGPGDRVSLSKLNTLRSLMGVRDPYRG